MISLESAREIEPIFKQMADSELAALIIALTEIADILLAQHGRKFETNDGSLQSGAKSM